MLKNKGMDNKDCVVEILDILSHENRETPSQKQLMQFEALALDYVRKKHHFSFTTVMAIAASFIVLLALNIMSLKASQHMAENYSQDQVEIEADILLPPGTLYYE